MSKNKDNNMYSDGISSGEMEELELEADNVQEDVGNYISKDKTLKGKYDGFLPLVESKKEAKELMNRLLADDARAAGADALIRGAAIKKQYNQMKNIACSLVAVATVATGLAGYAVYERGIQEDKYEALLQQAVQSMPDKKTQKAHLAYAQSVVSVMNQHPDKGIVEVTEMVVKQMEKSAQDISLPLRHTVGRDLMALAKSFDDMGVPRDMYLNVMVGYAKGRCSDYAIPQHSEEQIKGAVCNYIRSSSR